MCDEVLFLRNDRRKFLHGSLFVGHLTRMSEDGLPWLMGVVCLLTMSPGPFRDALGRPLVENGEIDPAAFIDDNGQAYLYTRSVAVDGSPTTPTARSRP